MASDVIKLEGETGWNESREPEARFELFELRPATMLHFTLTHDLFVYDGILRLRQDGSYAGRFSARGKYGSRECEATCRLAEAADGNELIGEWREKDDDERNMRPYFWWGTLSRLDDE